MGLSAFQVRRVLLIASLYDSFMLEEDGRLPDLLAKAYHQREMDYVPSLSRVTGAGEALEAVRAERFDLVVIMLCPREVGVAELARQLAAASPGTAVVVLGSPTPELARLAEQSAELPLDGIFAWQGDGRVLLGILQLVEDARNVAPAPEGVETRNVILLVEDTPAVYSACLHRLYDALHELTEAFTPVDIPYTQRLVRLRARPKVLLAPDWETAVRLWERYRRQLVGVVTDVRIPRQGRPDPQAGVEFVRAIRAEDRWVPVLVQSSEEGLGELFEGMNASLLAKDDHEKARDFRFHLRSLFGFGPLRLRDGDAGTRAVNDVHDLAAACRVMPGEALLDAWERGDLARWLSVRAEQAVIDDTRAQYSAEAETPHPGEHFRHSLAEALRRRHVRQLEHGIGRFSRAKQGEKRNFVRLGDGSLGGKARGLAFFSQVLSDAGLEKRIPGARVVVPRTLVLATDVFDEFISSNDLWRLATTNLTDRQTTVQCLKASLPDTLVGDLRAFLAEVQGPLAVRSSSLLEDALYQPFAGIYATKMIPNHHRSFDARFYDFTNAIKLVLASTFFQQAKAYITATGHRVEEEKMAVVIQSVVGRAYRERFYPHFSGVAGSYDFYPAGHARPADGVANVALGLGKTIVDGGVSLRFCPRYPQVLPQFGTVTDQLRHSQRTFWAVSLKGFATAAQEDEDQFMENAAIKVAEEDGVLAPLAATYSPDDDRVRDGLDGQGPRIVNFSGVLRHGAFPLADILTELLPLAASCMGTAIEMEFAGVLPQAGDEKGLFALLQTRPMVTANEMVTVSLPDRPPPTALAASPMVLGNGVDRSIRDIVLVKRETFDPAQTRNIAREVGTVNRKIRAEERQALLVGPGRWGSADPWLGIPVSWEQISAARVIVETALPGMEPDPSQGSHFFQNLTSLRVGYFTIPGRLPEAFLDWDWLESLPIAEETAHVRHIRLERPIEVRMDGRTGAGMMFKEVQVDAR